MAHITIKINIYFYDLLFFVIKKNLSRFYKMRISSKDIGKQKKDFLVIQLLIMGLITTFIYAIKILKVKKIRIKY